MLCETCTHFDASCGSIRTLGFCYCVNSAGVRISRFANITMCRDFKEDIDDHGRISNFEKEDR